MEMFLEVEAEKEVYILVVDDDRGEHELLRRYLGTGTGWKPEVTFATNGAEALEMIERRPVDVVLLDHDLGADNGLDVLEQLGRLALDTPPAVIMLTAQGDEELAADAMRAGALDYLPKGRLTPEGLQRAILRALDTAELKKQVEAQRKILEEQASYDDLTGLYNRRALMDALSREVSRAARLGSPLCLFMLDLDHFKEINDAHGHLTGDEVLSRSAKIIHESIRTMDSAGRYGGEEFCVLLPGSNLEAAHPVASRIHAKIAALPFTGAGGRELSVTCSIGIAEFEIEAGEDISRLIERADRALYRAKESGRNRICLA